MLVECPVTHWPGIDVDKAGTWVPAYATALHRSCRRHCLAEPRAQVYIESAAADMLAVFGHAKGRARQHRIGLCRAISRKDRCSGLADCIEDVRQKVDQTDVDLGLLAGMVVA